MKIKIAIWFLIALGTFLLLAAGTKSNLTRVGIIEVFQDEQGRTYMQASFRPEMYKSRCELLGHVAGEYDRLCSNRSGIQPAPTRTD